MLKKILIIAIILASFATCKKVESLPSDNNRTIPVDGTESKETRFNGELRFVSITSQINNTNTVTNYSASARFCSIPELYPFLYTWYAVQVGYVSLNNEYLYYDAYNRTYINKSPISTSNETWLVKSGGANGIATFSYSNNSSFPTYTLSTNIPEVVSKSAGLTLIINSSIESNEAYVSIKDSIDDYNNAIGEGDIKYVLNPGSNTITITSNYMNQLTPTYGPKGELSIVLNNNKAYYFGGKSYKFVKKSLFKKQIKITS